MGKSKCQISGGSAREALKSAWPIAIRIQPGDGDLLSNPRCVGRFVVSLLICDEILMMCIKQRTSSRAIASAFIFVGLLSAVLWSSAAWARGCDAGTNVNSFQDFDPATQEVIIQQLLTSGVQCVRTSLRPDEKNLHLAKELQDKGIGLVLVPGGEFAPNAPMRPANAQHLLRYSLALYNQAAHIVEGNSWRTRP
jgi:hypothetical protein